MSTRLYRLTALLQSVDQAIRDELRRRVPSTMRLLRLKTLKAAIKRRLLLTMTGSPQRA